MEIKQGDLLEYAKFGFVDVIAHGCNCFNTWGAGLAKKIKEEFPYAYEADLKTIKGDRSKLGTVTGTGAMYYIGMQFFDFDIINCYTQYNYGRNPNIVYLDYSALESCLIKINSVYSGMRLGLPWIGCGLANGDKNKVKSIIEKTCVDLSVTIVEYKT